MSLPKYVSNLVVSSPSEACIFSVFESKSANICQASSMSKAAEIDMPKKPAQVRIVYEARTVSRGSQWLKKLIVLHYLKTSAGCGKNIAHCPLLAEAHRARNGLGAIPGLCRVHVILFQPVQQTARVPWFKVGRSGLQKRNADRAC